MQEQYHDIGEAAGQIYRALEKDGEKTAVQLQKSSGVSDAAVFNRALGWLAREGNINFNKSGRTIKISLVSARV